MVVALSLSLALVVSQVEPAPPPAAVPPAAPAVSWPRWSVGTGVGMFDGLGLNSLVGVGGLGGSVGGLGGLLIAPASPTPRLTFERLFGEHLALALGLYGDYWSAKESDFERGSIGAMLGPRWIVTNPDAPVAISGYAAALVGYGLSSSNSGASSSSTLTIGGAAGLALERWLIDRLALRIQVQLIRATWNESRLRLQDALGGSASGWSHSTQVSFIPGPSAELRLYF